MDRHDRQARLREVGSTGQARIAQAVAEVRIDGLAADVAARYLAGAGVMVLRVRDATVGESARAIAPGLRIEIDPDLPLADDQELPALGLRDPAAREVARGALAALRTLRAAIEEVR